MRTSFGTAKRLFIAFTLLVSTFAFASYLTLAHVRQIHDGLLEMKDHEEGVRALARARERGARPVRAPGPHDHHRQRQPPRALRTDARGPRLRAHALRSGRHARRAGRARAASTDIERASRRPRPHLPGADRPGRPPPGRGGRAGRARARAARRDADPGPHAEALVERFEASHPALPARRRRGPAAAYRWTVASSSLCRPARSPSSVGVLGPLHRRARRAGSRRARRGSRRATSTRASTCEARRTSSARSRASSTR